MSKIKTSRIWNFKAVDKFEADFNGCSAIVIAGNNKGKTSFLRGMIDRIRFSRPDVMVKQGEDEGKGELTLTTGERFLWDFDTAGKDKLTLLDDEGIKKLVTKEIANKYFPPMFDIDKFLQSSPAEQRKQLQKIVGVDFTDVDARYKEAYDIRTAKNLDAERFHVKLSKMLEVPFVKAVDLTELQTKKETERTRLNDLYLKNKAENDKVRKAWQEAKDIILKEVQTHNKQQSDNRIVYNNCFDALNILKKNGLEYFDELAAFMESKRVAILDDKVAADLYPEEPTYIEERPDDTRLRKIDEEILSASDTNVKAKQYDDYKQYKIDTDAAQSAADQADLAVKAIEDERIKMIESAKFPVGITIDTDGIKVDGFALDNKQISSSKKYIAALRIAAINIGEVKSMYFDASYLDRKSLEEIQAWADEQTFEGEKGLQLLIERPDFEGGEMTYELIEHHD